MKFTLPLRHRALAGLAGLTLFSGLPCSSRADKAARPIEHKDYTLFMGANFQIEKNHSLYPVVDVVAGSFVIMIKGERVLVPVDNGDLRVRVDETLRITPDEAAVRNLSAERAYTPARDPQKRFLRETVAMSDITDTRQAEANANASARQLSSLQAGTGGAGNMPPAARQQALTQAQASNMSSQIALNHASAQAMSMQHNSGAFAGQLEDELARELFDAVEIDFRVSCDKPLAKPFFVFVARYRAPEDRPDQARSWIFAKQLNPIGPKERHEHFLQGGLAPGFTLISSEFHLYNEGKEIATDIAHKRVALSREDAYEYSMIEYIAAHKKDQAAPIPAMSTLPSDFLIHLSPDEVQGTYYAKVGADGRVREVYKDEACKLKVENPYLAEGIKTILFEPAVDKGKPVDGVAKIRPNRIHYAIEPKV